MADRIKGITIEIDGNTTKLSKALEGVNKNIRKTQSELKDVDKLLKLNPNNITLLKQKQELLTKSVSTTKEKLKELNSAMSQMKASGVDETSDEYKALQREIIATKSDLKEAKEALKEFGSVGKQVAQEVGTSIKEAGEKISETGEKISGVGTAMMPATAAVVGLGTAAVKTTADFDEAMSKVAAISGATGDDFEKLREKAREMGSTTKFSASEAAEAMTYMAMAGWKTDDMLSGIEGIMNLAAASGESLQTTSDIVTDAMTALGMSVNETSIVMKDGLEVEVSNTARFADVLAAASANANTNVSMMGESFQYVAPVAGALGFNVEDVATALGLMANSGIKASSAGTALRTMFTNMANPTDKMKIAMDALGVSLDDGEGNMKSLAEIMQDLRAGFGELKISEEEFNNSLSMLDSQLEANEISQEDYDESIRALIENAYGAEGAMKAQYAAMLAGKTGMSGLLAIVNATEEDFTSLSDAIYNSNGSAEEMANVMQDNLNGQLTILKSQLQELAIQFGDILVPIIRKVVSVVQNLTDKLNAMDPQTKETIVKIAAVVAAVGPVLIIIGKLVSGIGAVIQVMGLIVANPIVLVIAAIIAAIVLLIANWDTVKEKATELWSHITEKFEAIKEAVTGKITEMKDNVSEKFENIKSAASEKFEAVKSVTSTILSAVASTTSENLGKMKSAFEKNGGGIKGIAAATWEGVKANFTTGFNVLDKLTNGKLTEIKDAFFNKFKEIKDNALQWGKDIIDNLVNGIKEKIDAVTDAVSEIAGKIKDFLGFSEPEKGPLSNFHTFMPDMIELMSKGITEGAKDLEKPLGVLANSLVPEQYVNVNYNDSGINSRLDAINRNIGGNSNVTVVLEGDAQGLFNVVRQQNNTFKRRTGSSAF